MSEFILLAGVDNSISEILDENIVLEKNRHKLIKVSCKPDALPVLENTYQRLMWNPELKELYWDYVDIPIDDQDESSQESD